MQTRAYSMFATEQCPKALAWMAALSAATGRGLDAEAWLVELVGALVFTAQARQAASTGASPPTSQDIVSTS